MSSSKPPGGRFGLLFGIKRRPSTNFQQAQEPSPTSQQHYSLELSTESDPFKANGPSILSSHAISGSGTVHYTPDFEIASSARDASSASASDPWLTATEEELAMLSAKNDQRRAANTATLLSLASNNGLPTGRTALSGNHDANRRDLRVAMNTADTAGRLTIRHDSAATSAESLALAAAIAHANGLVLQPSSSLVRSSSSGIEYPPPADEYPSPPPSRRGSAARPVDNYDSIQVEEEGESRKKGRTPALSIDILTVATTGSSSLPTTPALIDSFPATPHTNIPSCPPTSPAPSPSPSLAASPMAGLPIRGGRQRASSAADAWFSPTAPSARFYRPDLDEVWEVAGRDRVRYNYPLPNPGPPPSVPLPPEPLSPRLHSSALHRQMQQLELEFNSLTRKLSPISPLSTASQSLSTASSPTDACKILKKYPSRSKLRRESSSGISGSSGASSNRTLSSSVSTSTVGLPLSDSPFSSTEHSSSGHQFSTQSPRQVLSLGQQPPMDSNQSSSPKAREKDKKSKEKDSVKTKEEKEKEKDSFPKRRFFSKYASIGSVDKEAAKVIAVNTDLEDARSVRSIQSGTTGFMDEELGANLSLAISSAQKTQESCMALLSVSPPTSLRSPSDDMSSIGSIPRTPTRPRVSQSEYPHQHILPPAEILRLERVGFTAQDQSGRRGRDPSLSLSPISPLSTSSLNPLADWSRGSTNTSRTDIIPSSTSPRTRPYRSGSLATMSSSSSTLLNAHSPIRESPLASRSFAALPRPVDAVSQRRPSNASSLTPTRRPTSARSVTTPSSPVTGHSALSPPPRPRIRSLKSGNDLKGAMGDPEPESTESHFTALSPPPPRSSRRPSTASSSTSITQRQSILRKPSFLDIEDDDGRPSLEEATVAAAPGLGSDSYPTSSLTPSPSIRTLNALGGGRSSSSLSISTTSRQVSANPSDDSFLDMGKISLETIRSESSDRHAFQDLEPSPLQQRTAYIESLPYRSHLGSHYQRGDIIGSNY